MLATSAATAAPGAYQALVPSMPVSVAPPTIVSAETFFSVSASRNLTSPFKDTIATMAVAVETNINYFDTSNERVFYPGTAGYQRRKFDTRTWTINDLRGIEDEFTLDKNGFVVLKANWSEEDVEDTPEHIQKVVFPETIEKVKEAYVPHLLDCSILPCFHASAMVWLVKAYRSFVWV